MTAEQQFDFDLFVIGGGSGGRARRPHRSPAWRPRGHCRGLPLWRYLCHSWLRAQKAAGVRLTLSAGFCRSRGFGWEVPEVRFDWKKLVAAKNAEITRLEGAYSGNLDKAGVQRFAGYARFLGPNQLEITTADGRKTVSSRGHSHCHGR